VSVGRGTARPFEQIGAPWIDGARLAAELSAWGLPGVRFEATAFTPANSALAGARCEGVRVVVEDRRRIEPVRVGLAIAAALLRLHAGAWDPKNVMTLLGNGPTFEALLRGDSLDAMAAAWQPELRAFLSVRKKYMLYPE
jgi:uncharacterized protein YbbC (DUF1343 family)